jgi:hypothetical protein
LKLTCPTFTNGQVSTIRLEVDTARVTQEQGACLGAPTSLVFRFRSSSSQPYASSCSIPYPGSGSGSSVSDPTTAGAALGATTCGMVSSSGNINTYELKVLGVDTLIGGDFNYQICVGNPALTNNGLTCSYTLASKFDFFCIHIICIITSLSISRPTHVQRFLC